MSFGWCPRVHLSAKVFTVGLLGISVLEPCELNLFFFYFQRIHNLFCLCVKELCDSSI